MPKVKTNSGAKKDSLLPERVKLKDSMLIIVIF